ncbi:hypothetical protein HK405_004720 [Cladochytrium tenue]|nr:hypothetical protein HK405_004720 [Cladochytrium tenue]
MHAPFDPWMTAITAAATSPATSVAGVDAATRKSCRYDRDPVAALIAELDSQATVVGQPPPTPPLSLQSLPGREVVLDNPTHWLAGFPLPVAPFRVLDDENLFLLVDFERSELVLPDLLPYSPPPSIYRDAAVARRDDPAQALEDRAFRLFCNENICLVMRASQHQLVTVTRAVATLRRIWDDDVAGPLSVLSREYRRRASTSADRDDDDDEDFIDDDSAWFTDAAAALPTFPAPLAVNAAAAQHKPTAPPPVQPPVAYKPIAPAKRVSPSPSLSQALVQPPPATALLPATRRGGARRRAPSSSGSASSRPRGLAFHDFDPSKAGRRNSAPSLRREYRRRASVNSRAAKDLQEAATTAAAATMALVKQAPECMVSPAPVGCNDAGKADEDAAVDVSDVVRLMKLMSAELQVSDGGGGVAVGSRNPNPPVLALSPVPTAVEELPPPSPLFLQGMTPFGGWKTHEPPSSEALPASASAPVSAPDPQELLLWDEIDAALRLGASALEPEALLFMEELAAHM